MLIGLCPRRQRKTVANSSRRERQSGYHAGSWREFEIFFRLLRLRDVSPSILQFLTSQIPCWLEPQKYSVAWCLQVFHLQIAEMARIILHSVFFSLSSFLSSFVHFARFNFDWFAFITQLILLERWSVMSLETSSAHIFFHVSCSFIYE
jgi:hypothetical protein